VPEKTFFRTRYKLYLEKFTGYIDPCEVGLDWLVPGSTGPVFAAGFDGVLRCLRLQPRMDAFELSRMDALDLQFAKGFLCGERVITAAMRDAEQRKRLQAQQKAGRALADQAIASGVPETIWAAARAAPGEEVRLFTAGAALGHLPSLLSLARLGALSETARISALTRLKAAPTFTPHTAMSIARLLDADPERKRKAWPDVRVEALCWQALALELAGAADSTSSTRGYDNHFSLELRGSTREDQLVLQWTAYPADTQRAALERLAPPVALVRALKALYLRQPPFAKRDAAVAVCDDFLRSQNAAV
jgi:hypothetical protein